MSNWHKSVPRAVAVLTLGWSRTKRGKMALRRAAAGLVGAALRLKGRRLRVEGFAKILVIAPHPDDGSLGCGGTLALMTRGKTEIHILYVTDGSASHPGHPLLDPTAIAALRREEARSAMAILGVDQGMVTFLNAPDGRLPELAADPKGGLSGKIAEQLLAVRPDAIFLPFRRDGSTEHEAAFEIVRRALGQAGLATRVFEFPVWSWWNPTLLVPSIFAPGRVWRVRIRGAVGVKARATACYASQLQPLPPELYSALPEGFASMFLRSHEFFIEI